jgi:hypothetical protein
VAANLVAEYNLTQQGLQAIVSLYGKYYSDISQIYAAMQYMMAGMGMGVGAKPGKLSAAIGSTPKTTTKHIGSGGAAEGGTFLADKPTSMVFGEAGLEMATFTPIGRTGRDVNKVFSNMGGGSGNGNIQIEMLLSPDLEGRIISNTLNKTADVVFRTGRSK